MSLMDQIKRKAIGDKKHILLPEGTEERTVQAAARIVSEGIANVTLLGDETAILAVADKFHVDLAGVALLNPETSSDLARYTEMFYELRKAKGVTPEKAAATMKNPLFFAAMMIKDGRLTVTMVCSCLPTAL